MRPFLRGFADELIKIASSDPWSDLPRPRSTVKGTEQAAQPQNALRASNQGLRAIPQQRMEWSPSAKPKTWEPSPGLKVEKKAPPSAPKPTGTPKPKPVKAEPAWEDVQTKAKRTGIEGAYNKGRSPQADVTRDAPPRLPEADKLNAKGLVAPMSPERRAFFAAQPQNPKINAVRKPGGLRGSTPDLPASGNTAKVRAEERAQAAAKELEQRNLRAESRTRTM